MHFIQFVGCCVLIGVFDWCVLYVLRIAIKYTQRLVAKAMS